ncbi:hypothetical protein HF521_006510 [Silurus meridionalis]|uniref:Importin N-terminal domain-containing protein n=1 Tax=Silurus meridionalis TaxID=175797 RepID=A0A8T0ANQ0_SILME|nr:hypothetical protein HF521_006510 [Silurus meridionalis]
MISFAEMDLQVSVLLEVLSQASSQDSALLKPAEEQLRHWENQPGFYSTLQSIFNNHVLDVNVRWLAVLYFKNGIDRYWRRGAPNAISEEEKSSLRAGLISNFNEPVHQIATQIAVLIAKVARLDCPRQWPELVPVLLEAIKHPDELHQHRALLTLTHVIKTLASKRLSADRALFQHLASSIYSFACSLWNHHTDMFLLKIQSRDPHTALSALEHTLLSLKVLRKLTVNGFVEPHQNMEVMGFLGAVFDRLRQCLECCGHVGGAHACREKLEKIIILYTKVFLDFLETHPYSFIPLIQHSLEFSVSFIFTEQGDGLVFERFIVQCMNLIKMIIKNAAYKPAKNIEDSKAENLEAHRIKSDFFTHSTLSEMCKRLVCKYLLLTQEELNMWEEDPESFAVEETGGDSWKYSLRPCTEVLFLDLFHNYSQILTPVLLDMVHTLRGVSDGEDSVQMLMKDSVYNAVGLAAYELFDSVDFDQWFKNQLLVELQCNDSRYKVIRRRVIWLVAEGQVQVLKVVEIALKVSPVLACHMFQSLLPAVFRGVMEGERYPVVMSTYLGIIGRVLLQNSSFFSSLLTQMAIEFNQEVEQLLGNLVEMWVDRMDNITQPERRKLSSLALLSLLPSDNIVVQEKFCGIVNICVESLHDVMTEEPETGTFRDCLLVSGVDETQLSDDDEPPTEQDKRRKLLALEDPVHSVSLQQCVYEKLKLQQELMGDQSFQSLMETVDTEIVHQLQEFLHRL